MATKRTAKKQKLSLHHLLVAISYWGTTVRFLLFVMILLIAIGVHQLVPGALDWIMSQIFALIYLASLFLLMDAGYVTIARTGTVTNYSLDKATLFFCDSVFALFVILPYFATVSYKLNVIWLLISVLLVLAVRLVFGMSYSRR